MDQVRIAGRSSATATLGASETAGTATKGEPAGDSMNPTTIARGATGLSGCCVEAPLTPLASGGTQHTNPQSILVFTGWNCTAIAVKQEFSGMIPEEPSQSPRVSYARVAYQGRLQSTRLKTPLQSDAPAVAILLGCFC